MFRLDGTPAVITGAARGMGYAVAADLVELGATVILLGKDRYAVAAAAGTL